MILFDMFENKIAQVDVRVDYLTDKEWRKRILKGLSECLIIKADLIYTASDNYLRYQLIHENLPEIELGQAVPKYKLIIRNNGTAYLESEDANNGYRIK